MRSVFTYFALGWFCFLSSAEGAITGHWDFAAGDLKATIGQPLEYADGPQGDTAKTTQFATTTALGIASLDGKNVTVLHFPVMSTPLMGYRVRHGGQPNGDGDQVNNYTVLMDVLFPESGAGIYGSLLQLDNEGDSDIYLGPANGLGISGGYAGKVSLGRWHRLVFAFELSGRVPTVSKFIDGTKAERQILSQGRDGRWSVGPHFALFSDPNHESRAGYLHCLQFRDRTLSDAEIQLLGKPSAAGIPTNDLPDHPFVESVSPPADGFGIALDAPIEVVVLDGRLSLRRDTVQLLLNGKRVTPSIARSERVTTLRYQPKDPFTQPTNVVLLVYGDGTVTMTNRWGFVTELLGQSRKVTGQWDFRGGNLDASVGAPMGYLDGASRQALKFGSIQSFGLPALPGPKGAQVPILFFNGVPNTAIGLTLPPGAGPNGRPTPTRVNQWTLIVDLLVPNTQREPWLALLQTDEDNTSEADVFLEFRDGRAGIGSLGQYSGEGAVVAGRWHRIAVAMDNVALTMSKYIDGEPFATQELRGVELNGRYSLGPTALLFADDNGESQPVYASSVQIRNYVMNPDEIVALGGPTSEKIPRTNSAAAAGK